MANEIEEVRYQVGEAWKGEYNAATPYGVAAVVQDPTGLSVYRSLKNGNTGHPLTDTNWWFCIIDMSSIKAASDDVDALNTEVSEDEAARVSAEAGRALAENDRVAAESGRVIAEDGRASSENSRKTAENARVSAESARASAESSRATAESARVSAENARVLAENLRDNAESSRATAETNRAAAESERHTQYTADHNTAVSDHTTAQLDHTTAVADHEQATADHTASVTATGEASNVNAEIDGLVVTITDRNGQSHSVNIGFDIAGTYGSVSAMNADAANVQEGAFVMIATLDPTSQENARLYVRNSTAPTSSEPFTFLSDLDQAATSAWADWMENYKPTITADHTRAEADHTTAAADHTAAVSDHNTATTDHTQAASDHSTAASDHTAAASDHTRAESDHTTAAADHTQAESDHTRAETDHSTMEPRIANLEENKANKDGYYSQMTVGAAETLVGQTVDSEAYLIRPTGGESNEVANGVASVLGMEGNSAVWNQQVKNPNFSINEDDWTVSNGVTVTHENGYIKAVANDLTRRIGVAQEVQCISGHKYLVIQDFFVPTGCSGIWLSSGADLPNTSYADENEWKTDKRIFTSSGNTLSARWWFVSNNGTTPKEVRFHYCNVFDLTLLGIDNLTTVAEVEEWLAKHIGTKPYYAYNAGTILSAQTLGIKTYGQNLLNPTTRQAKLIPYEWEENSNVYTIKNVPSGATATFTPDATGVAVSVTITNDEFDITSYGSGILELSAATADTYVCMKWDEQKDDDVVPYEDHTQNFDVRKVFGKVNGAGEYVQCFPNGLRGAGTAKDTLTASEAVVNVGSVDLGTLPNWAIYKTNVFRTTDTDGLKKIGLYNLTCSKYVTASNGGGPDTIGNGYICGHRQVGNVYIHADGFATLAAFEASLNGVMLNYELAEPITYTDLIYRDGGIDTPLSDVLMNIEVNNWSMEEQLLTPYDENGNPTAVPAKISTQYGMDAVEAIDTIKHTYVSAYSEQNFSNSKKAQARRNIGAVEENGTYPNMSVGSAKNLAGENAVEAEYTYRPSNGTIGTDTGIANVTDVKGETLVWNQLLPELNATDYSQVNANASFSNGVVTFTATAQSGTGAQISFLTIVGHICYCSALIKSTSNSVQLRALGASKSCTGSGIWEKVSLIKEVQTSAPTFFVRDQRTNGWDEVQAKDYVCIDLTELFGAGNEPSTVAEFEALYPLDYYAYTATPVLINNAASGIVTTGFNQWDEEWEQGSFNNSTGQKIPYTTATRSKNYIKVIPNTEYNIKINLGSQSNSPVILFYDANYNHLANAASKLFTTPNNAHYIMFRYNNAEYGSATYNNDICINISDSAKNGTYEPYEKHTFYFDKVLQGEGSLATIKGKLNGEGESVVVFPDGLKRVGNVFDEIKGNVAIKRIGSVDMGDVDWTYSVNRIEYNSALSPAAKASASNNVAANIICGRYATENANNTVDKSIVLNTSGKWRVYDSAYTDADTFTAAMSGVMLYYELATPETYILDQTVTGGYQVNALGTEKRLPEDTASAVNAPVSYSVIYPIDAVGTITKLPINYISEKSLTNFTTELASKLGTFLNATIGISATYNQTTQEYDYTITITQN